jgi:outer membrane lipoprotein SlyB
MHPIIIVAAGAVTLFCGVGIGVMTGLIPSAHSLSSPSTTQSAMPPTPFSPGAAQAPVGSSPVVAEAPATDAARDLKPVDKTTMGQPLARADARSDVHPTKKPVATPSRSTSSVSNTAAPTPTYTSGVPSSATERPVVVASNSTTTPTAVPPIAPPAPVVCNNCGVIESVLPVTQQGQGSGAGAVIGGVLGGVLGHQVGNGKGKDVATVAGAVGGAVLGNHIEKSGKASQHYNVRVRLDDGTFQTIRSETDPGFRPGEKVRLENGRIVRQ